MFLLHQRKMAKQPTSRGIYDSLLINAFTKTLFGGTHLSVSDISQLSVKFYENIITSVTTVQNYLGTPVVLLFDTPGGRLVPAHVQQFPSNREDDDFEEESQDEKMHHLSEMFKETTGHSLDDVLANKAKEIFTEIWGVKPSTEDIHKIVEVLKR